MVSDGEEAKMGDDETEQNSYITCTFQMTNYGNDVKNDGPSNNGSVTKLDIFFTSFSIVSHMFHAGFGLSLCARYFFVDQLSHFYLTAAFIFIPSMINTAISLRMYNQDIEKSYRNPGTYNRKSLESKVIRFEIWYIFIAIFQLAPVIRLIDSLIYGIKSRKCEKQGDSTNQQRYYIKMLKEDQNIALLRVFECFLEAAPLQILQFAIVLRNYHPTFSWELVHQCFSIFSSLVSMGWAMATNKRGARLSQSDGWNVGLVGTILQFLWPFLITVSRIISASVLATLCYLSIGLFSTVHWLLMTLLILWENSEAKNFCRNRKRAPNMPSTLHERICTVMFAFVIGAVHIFIYMHHTEGPTVIRHSLFYAVCFAENLVACVLWATGVSNYITKFWHLKFFITLSILMYILGAIAMILYYIFFHPKSKKKCETSYSREYQLK